MTQPEHTRNNILNTLKWFLLLIPAAAGFLNSPQILRKYGYHHHIFDRFLSHPFTTGTVRRFPDPHSPLFY